MTFSKNKKTFSRRISWYIWWVGKDSLFPVQDFYKTMSLAVFISRIFELYLKHKLERTPPLTAPRQNLCFCFFHFSVKKHLFFPFERRRKTVFQKFPILQKQNSLWKCDDRKFANTYALFSCEIRSNNLTMTLKCVWMCVFRSYLVNSLTCQWFLFM